MSSLTQKWLRHNLQPYAQRDRVYCDIDSVLSRFPTLRPKSDVYSSVLLSNFISPLNNLRLAYDDGRTQLLLCVHGLLPISFRGASYNIPIATWVTRDYPREPPIAYVVPTNDMLVKAGKYIDVSGRCDIEFLQHWARKSEGCSLLALLEAMQDQFSREPPVYAKPPANVPAATSSPVGDPRGRPPPPLPSAQPVIAPSPQARPMSPDRPVIPPKPTVSVFSVPGTHQPQILTTSPPIESIQASPGALGSGSEPPLPPRPPSDTLPPQYRTSYAEPFIPPSYAIPAARNLPEPTLYPSHQESQIPVFGSASPAPLTGSPPVHPQPHSTATAAPLTYHHQQVPFHSPPSDHAAPQPPRAPIVNLLDEDSPDTQINATLAFAPPPPRPPNPELLHLHDQVYHKVTSELNSLSQALVLDAERLRAHQTDLLAGEPAIRDEMARLEAVRDVCRSVAGRMKGSVQQAEINIAELRRKGDPEVDELICSTTIVHNQWDIFYRRSHTHR
ncbi:hypothetical protein D9615_003922 [Tricholomella constricta]|uniref:UEV domain-containing protein n=1 Tax=Tricholomella constricta TaxID=117010 RepID=A0A8H5M4Q7_9AGAR|nr:hypothetical protein D9615_003922 [Tricholomella constricta]